LILKNSISKHRQKHNYCGGTNFTITGIYQTGNFITDSGGFMALNTLQNLTSNDGKISAIAVKVTNNANVTTVS
jgi:putative ABC transport system permease protein